MTQPPAGPPPSDPGPPEFPPYPAPTGPGYPPVGPPAGGYPPVPPAGPAGVEPYPPYPPYPQANPQGYPPAYPPSPYGYPAVGAYPPVQSAQSTNGFATAALIFGIIPICAGILGVTFGFVGLSQIKRTRQKGRGLAIAGIVLGFLWIIGSVVLVAVGASNSAKRDDAGHISQPGEINVTKLRTGDCIADIGDEKFYTTTKAIPCSQPHKAEVYALLPLSGSSVPDMSTMEETAKGCSDSLDRYSPSAYEDDNVEVTYMYPTRQSWREGDHSITCIATFAAERTQSIKGK